MVENKDPSLSALEPKDEEPFPEFQEEEFVPEHRALLGRREEPCLEAYGLKNNVTFRFHDDSGRLKTLWPKRVRRWTEAHETVEGVLETYLARWFGTFWHRFQPVNSSFGKFAISRCDWRSLGIRFGHKRAQTSVAAP